MIWGYFFSLLSVRSVARVPTLLYNCLFCFQKKLTTLALGVSNQPLQRDVNVVLLLARDAVAANLPVLYAGQVPKNVQNTTLFQFNLMQISSKKISHSLNQSSFIQRSGNVPLVAEHQHRNADQLGLVQQRVQLVPGRFHLVQIGRIHHVAVDSTKTSKSSS